MSQQSAIQEKLKTFESTDWVDRRLKAFGLLSPARAAGKRLLSPLKPSKKDLFQSIPTMYAFGFRTSEEDLKTANLLERQTKNQLQHLFQGLFPRIAPHVERAWELFHGLPYQLTAYRHGFRAPHEPAITALPRMRWLRRLIDVLGKYEQDIEWVAAWAGHLSGWWAVNAEVGVLLAAAIDGGGETGDRVLEILEQSARGEHEIGVMGHHVPQALLMCSRPDAWEFIEKMLLAAQREEGLRQVILETVDLAHPEAFRRMLRLILKHDLLRFSATVRALDTWFAFHWDSAGGRGLEHTVERALAFLESPDEREKALREDNAEEVYLALWAAAMDDTPAAVPPAVRLLDSPDPERRFAAAYFLGVVNLTSYQCHMRRLLDDEDPRIAAFGLTWRRSCTPDPEDRTEDVAALERLFERAPEKKKKQEPILWPWCVYPLDKKSVSFELFRCTGEKSPLQLLKYVRYMEPFTRQQMAGELGKQRDAKARSALLDLAGDTSTSVRQSAIQALEKARGLDDDEAEKIEGFLTRKASDLRRGVLTLLLRQGDSKVLASADRLLAAKTEPQRAAGMELLRKMVETNRSKGPCEKRLLEVESSEEELSQRERVQIEAAVGGDADTVRGYTLENALGLIDPGALTKAPTPRACKLYTDYRAAAACIKAIDDLVHEHRERPVTIPTHDNAAMDSYLAPGDSTEAGVRGVLLGEAQWAFPGPPHDKSPEELAAHMPLGEVWRKWYSDRSEKLRDADGQELIRATLLLALPEKHNQAHGLLEPADKGIFASAKLPRTQYPNQTRRILNWLFHIHTQSGALEYIFNTLETTLSLVPDSMFRDFEPSDPFGNQTWQELVPISTCVGMLREIRECRRDLWNEECDMRFWRSLHWMFESVLKRTSRPSTTTRSVRAGLAGLIVQTSRRTWAPNPEEVYRAFRAGALSEADVLAFLFTSSGWGRGTFPLSELTRRKDVPTLRETPGLRELVDRARDRILEVELKRGEIATPASTAALALHSIFGAETALGVLDALGKATLVRGYLYDNESRECVLSHLLRVTYPLPSDTLEAFAERAKELHIAEKRLIEMAVYAPQWARFIEHATDHAGLEDAVWWLYAHTKVNAWHVAAEVREWWAAEVTERTPLTAADLLDGAVGVAWFGRAYDRLGASVWKKLDAAAKYASSGVGHSRARLYADALLGRASGEELTKRMLVKRHQDSARSLGLVPLPEDHDQRQAEVLTRYEAIQEFLRTGKKFGSQRQASEKRAAAIGMDNLARTAGYADPIRLQWAMERMLVADLAAGPVSVIESEVTVSLSVDGMGVPQIAVEKKGKRLASVPASVKKRAAVKELLNRKTALKRQVSRMRQSLETAMLRGDRFTGAELVELHGHALLAPMLRNLVFYNGDAMGYPIEEGRALHTEDGTDHAVGATEELRVAHPYDLLQSGRWDRWQHDCFAAERVQPFKQVFRELYVLTDAERQDRTISRRYAGHQVHPKQAIALLGGRGWVQHPDGGVRRTFHEEGLSAWLEGMFAFFTPAEIEGVTLEGIHFSKSNSWESLPLEEIPPRVFSEVMRDVDLVVSVAHRGGVDPEASASTVDMRAALIKETLQLLKIENVRIDGRRAMISGKLGEYAVHLGSAVVHVMPGGMLFIVPVGAQHRGRLFLPFADDDPKTAEVLSKVILLARDDQIKDPNILSQIRSG